ncbi:MAG: hypothetical protein IPI67_12750 [Myxococcales bacterium]|nr:hypothetical protein [Myxococcales bacterium]
MSLTGAELQARAKRRFAQLQRGRRDPRYARVLGRLCALGLVVTNFEVERYTRAITIDDALWVGKLEPRVLELLPALVVKAPALFVDARALPPDLAQAVRALRRGEPPEDFRGIPGRDLVKWLPRVGRKDKLPSLTKAFRLRQEDLKLLARLSHQLGITETDVVRRGLRSLAASELLDD